MEKIYNENNSKLNLEISDLKSEIGNIYKKIKNISVSPGTPETPGEPSVPLDGCLIGIDGDNYIPLEADNYAIGGEKVIKYSSNSNRPRINNILRSERIYIKSFLPNLTPVHIKVEYIAVAKKFEEKIHVEFYTCGVSTDIPLTQNDVLDRVFADDTVFTKKPALYVLEGDFALPNTKINNMSLDFIDLNDNLSVTDIKYTIYSGDVEFTSDGAGFGLIRTLDLATKAPAAQMFYILKNSRPKIRFTGIIKDAFLSDDCEAYILKNYAYNYSGETLINDVIYPNEATDTLLVRTAAPSYLNRNLHIFGYCGKENAFVSNFKQHNAGDMRFYRHKIKDCLHLPVACTYLPYAHYYFDGINTYNSLHMNQYVIFERRTNQFAKTSIYYYRNEALKMYYGGLNERYETVQSFLKEDLPFREVFYLYPLKNRLCRPTFLVGTEKGNFLFESSGSPDKTDSDISLAYHVNYDTITNIGNDFIVDASAYAAAAKLNNYSDPEPTHMSVVVRKQDGVYFKKYNLQTHAFENIEEYIGPYRKAYTNNFLVGNVAYTAEILDTGKVKFKTIKKLTN